MPFGLWHHFQQREYNGRNRLFFFPNIFQDNVEYVASQTKFSPESDEGLLAKIFAPFLPDYEKKWEEHWTRDTNTHRFEENATPWNFLRTHHRRQAWYNTPEAWQCEIYWDQSLAKQKQRDHMASYPKQYNPPVGQYWGQVVGLQNEALRLKYKYDKCVWYAVQSTHHPDVKGRGKITVDEDKILEEYEGYGKEIEEMKKKGELEKAKKYLGVYVGGDHDHYRAFSEAHWRVGRNT